VIGALAVPTALVLLSGCTDAAHGTIRSISSAAPTTAATTSTSAAPTPTVTPSAVASKESSSAKPQATKPQATRDLSQLLDRKSVAQAALAKKVVYLGVSNGHLLTVDGHGTVSMSRTKADYTNRLVLKPAGTDGRADKYLIMSQMFSQESKAHCLSLSDLGTFILAVCDRNDETQNITFREAGNREFALTTHLGSVFVDGNGVGANPDADPNTRFTVSVTART
jgi:hypothetical protein